MRAPPGRCSMSSRAPSATVPSTTRSKQNSIASGTTAVNAPTRPDAADRPSGGPFADRVDDALGDRQFVHRPRSIRSRRDDPSAGPRMSRRASLTLLHGRGLVCYLRHTRGPSVDPQCRRGRRDPGKRSPMPTAEALQAADTLIHVLWINAGLSCDGDSVALTAATQPSIEEIALGALPGLPKIAVHWPLIDFECGPNGGADDFLEWFFKADRGELEPFVLVVEGSIPNEAAARRGLLVRVRQRPRDRPADDDERVARPADAEGAGGASPSAPAPPTAASTPWPATRPAPWACPTTSAGTGSRRPASRSCACPGCPIQPDNLSETILYLLYQATGQAPMIPLDDALRPTVAVRRDRARGLRPGRLLRAGRLRRPSTARRSASSSSAAGARSSSATCPSAAGSTASAAARTSAASASAARCPASPTSSCRSWTSRRAAGSRPRRSALYGTAIRRLRSITDADARPGTEVAQAGHEAHHRAPSATW